MWCSALFLNRLEGVLAAFSQKTDAVDDVIGAFNRRLDRVRVTQIGLNEGNLADIAERLQEQRQIRTTADHADAITALGKRPDHIAANKAGTADHGYKRRKVCQGHERLLEGLWLHMRKRMRLLNRIDAQGEERRGHGIRPFAYGRAGY